MHANLILLFKPALCSSTLVIILFESSIKLFYAKILTGQSSIISFAARMARPSVLKLKHSVLLVIYNWLNGFNEWQIQHYLALLWK